MGYLNSLKEIVFPGEEERRGQSNLFFCPSFFASLQQKNS